MTTTTKPPRQRHSETSAEAADKIEPNAGTLRRLVLNHLRALGNAGATDIEIQTALGLDPSTQRPRRVELCRDMLVHDSGRTRRTPSGRRATVWVADPAWRHEGEEGEG